MEVKIIYKDESVESLLIKYKIITIFRIIRGSYLGKFPL
jgi:hypothetical protein